VAIVLSPLVARLLTKIDARLIVSVALAAFGVSFLMRSHYNAQASFEALMLPLPLQGVGMAALFIASLAILLDKLPQERIPSATGLSNFMRITAGSFAASITTTFWDRHAAANQTRLAETANLIQDGRVTLEALRMDGVSESQAMALSSRVLSGQAHLLSALEFFWISGCLMLLLIVLVWFTRRPVGGAPEAAE
jgi:DHA2 family multidrug resistance protein